VFEIKYTVYTQKSLIWQVNWQYFNTSRVSEAGSPI